VADPAPDPLADDLGEDLADEARLAIAWTPAAARARMSPLLALDHRLGTILRNKREPLLAQMRLAWWRDRLAEAPESWPRGDLVLDALRLWREPGALAGLVDGWEALLGDHLDEVAISTFADARGRGFAALARELGENGATQQAMVAGRLWALADLAANISDPAERAAVLAHASADAPPPPLPRALRGLAVLAGLARRSLARGGTPLMAGRGSALAALRIGLVGR
jgi:phytoene synthase